MHFSWYVTLALLRLNIVAYDVQNNWSTKVKLKRRSMWKMNVIIGRTISWILSIVNRKNSTAGTIVNQWQVGDWKFAICTRSIVHPRVENEHGTIRNATYTPKLVFSSVDERHTLRTKIKIQMKEISTGPWSSETYRFDLRRETPSCGERRDSIIQGLAAVVRERLRVCAIPRLSTEQGHELFSFAHFIRWFTH